MSTIFPQDSVVAHRLEKAQHELRKASRPDYYGLLSITSVASELEIKAAYKKAALEWHPDKHPEETREAAEKKFKDVGEALEVLTDPIKRQLYDEGYDKEAIEERAQRAQRAARSHHYYH
eukprot:NODE_2322_length_944_cov_11.387709_g1911_i0.p4 GENE.NODE_2322_length_944_cov_11.387709_g1911_i0~~NODE_2322_length_944_cov_11.387709_g1911_i0.p4  ORF type:complete len:120 (+),score=38.22 NODE_2322_length_944_cov_11.387709_g1911_i0:507-866(+)